MSDYYRVQISEYNEMLVMVAKLSATVDALKLENARLADDNRRLIDCVERFSKSPEQRFRVLKRCNC